MRGEDADRCNELFGTDRITPACAGKTRMGSRRRRVGPDHPRMRGEDHPVDNKQAEEWGSPPHARGRLLDRVDDHARPGITPACAGKTAVADVGGPSGEDHPRMRGED